MKILAVLLSISVLAAAELNILNAFGNLGKNIVQDINSASNTIPIISDAQDFVDFILKTGKSYATPAEYALRQGVFAANKILIDAKNAAFKAGHVTYTLAINAFADLTDAEFFKRLAGSRRTAAGDKMAKQHQQTYQPHAAQKIPESFDWREKGAITAIKDQDTCGACWSFAVTGAIEGHVFRKTGKLPNLSEQNLLDCGTNEFGLDGCDGGFHDYGFAFLKSHNDKGIASTANYPYIGKTIQNRTCAYTENIKAADINGFATIPQKNQHAIKQVVATLGPVACALRVERSLSFYSGGIYNNEECNKGNFIHAVVIVGYGSTNEQDFWIAKNSWGKWGEDGYFRILRGKNLCGIEEYCSIPLV